MREEEGGGGIFKDGEERIGKEKVVLGKIRCHGKKKRVNNNLSFFFSKIIPAKPRYISPRPRITYRRRVNCWLKELRRGLRIRGANYHSIVPRRLDLCPL